MLRIWAAKYGAKRPDPLFLPNNIRKRSGSDLFTQRLIQVNLPQLSDFLHFARTLVSTARRTLFFLSHGTKKVHADNNADKKLYDNNRQVHLLSLRSCNVILHLLGTGYTGKKKSTALPLEASALFQQIS